MQFINPTGLFFIPKNTFDFHITGIAYLDLAGSSCPEAANDVPTSAYVKYHVRKRQIVLIIS